MSDEFDPPSFFRNGVYCWGTPAAYAERQKRAHPAPDTPLFMRSQYDLERLLPRQAPAPVAPLPKPTRQR